MTLTGPFSLVARVYFTDGKDVGSVDMPFQPGTLPDKSEVDGMIAGAVEMTRLQMPNMRLLNRAELETHILGIEASGKDTWE